MPPAYKGTEGVRDVGYGVYDLWDLGEFDQKGTVPTKYGTRREYASAVVALREAGIDVLGDIVLNHKMGADGSQEVAATQVAADNRLYEMSDSTRERDYHRQKYLESRGWKIHRVWTPGFWKNQEKEIAGIIDAIERS